MFDAAQLAALVGAFPNEPVYLRHELEGHPLFARARMTLLAGSTPKDEVICRPAQLPLGALPFFEPDPRPPALVAQTLETSDAWLKLGSIDHDPEYKTLVDDSLRPLKPIVKMDAGGLRAPAASLVMAAPYAVTPLHLEPNYLLIAQIRGRQRVTLFTEETYSPSVEQLETLHTVGTAQLSYETGMEDKGQPYDLAEGDALFIPVTTPYLIQHGEDITMSLSITWSSPELDQEADAYRLNAWLRGKGWPQKRISNKQIRLLKAKAYKIFG